MAREEQETNTKIKNAGRRPEVREPGGCAAFVVDGQAYAGGRSGTACRAPTELSGFGSGATDLVGDGLRFLP